METSENENDQIKENFASFNRQPQAYALVIDALVIDGLVIDAVAIQNGIGKRVRLRLTVKRTERVRR